MSKPGILFVFSEPGPAVSDAEYNDWYDNEHVPLRIPIPAFQSWSRWVAVDGQKPSYFALYDLTDADAVNHPPYSTLADTRSEREKDIIKRLALLDRRTYDRLDVPVPPRAGDAYDVRNPGPYVIAVLMEVAEDKEEDFNGWYNEEHIALLAKVPQWVRSTRYVLRESGASGTDESLRPKGPGGRAPKYLALHEWTGPEAVGTDEFKHAVGTEWSARVKEYATIFDIRTFKFLKSWERV
ncbi:hypothetical protein C8Q76DRAFT_234297 [Earliella scabrosa]|nr:hypothetical protein C8Q76DRAFT_234297 [Earliella scabrosa]